jgi:cytochrome c-type biogenesis protein CcmH/NrfF
MGDNSWIASAGWEWVQKPDHFERNLPWLVALCWLLWLGPVACVLAWGITVSHTYAHTLRFV